MKKKEQNRSCPTPCWLISPYPPLFLLGFIHFSSPYSCVLAHIILKLWTHLCQHMLKSPTTAACRRIQQPDSQQTNRGQSAGELPPPAPARLGLAAVPGILRVVRRAIRRRLLLPAAAGRLRVARPGRPRRLGVAGPRRPAAARGLGIARHGRPAAARGLGVTRSRGPAAAGRLGIARPGRPAAAGGLGIARHG